MSSASRCRGGLGQVRAGANRDSGRHRSSTKFGSDRRGAGCALPARACGHLVRGRRRGSLGQCGLWRQSDHRPGDDENQSARISAPGRIGTGGARPGARQVGQLDRTLQSRPDAQARGDHLGRAVRSDGGAVAGRSSGHGICGKVARDDAQEARGHRDQGAVRGVRAKADGLAWRICFAGQTNLRTGSDRSDQAALPDAGAVRAAGESRDAGETHDRREARRLLTPARSRESRPRSTRAAAPC